MRCSTSSTRARWARAYFRSAGCAFARIAADAYRIADKSADNGFVHVTALIGHGRPLDVQQRAAEELFAVLTKHLEPLYAKSPLAISLNVQEFHPVLNFKKNNLHEYVKRRGGTP